MREAIIVIGSSGHAKVCIEILQAMGRDIDYCIGAKDTKAAHCLGIPVLKGDEHLLHLRREGYAELFIAIGDNHKRQHIAALGRQQGYKLINALSPKAMISPSVKLGTGIAIMASAVINADSVIEDLVIINTAATVDHDCVVGKAVHIAPQCALAGNVIIGARSMLGIGCKVIPRITIGADVTIGAGGVVISDICDNTVAVGIPAK